MNEGKKTKLIQGRINVDVNQETVNQQRPARMVGYHETENSRPGLKNKMFSSIEPSIHGLRGVL